MKFALAGGQWEALVLKGRRHTHTQLLLYIVETECQLIKESAFNAL